MAKLLPLKDGARSTVYTLIVHALKNDPVLKRTVGRNWITYTGEPDVSAPASSGSLPSIEVVPMGLGATPETNARANAPLGIQVRVTTEGNDVRDLLNLWDAFEASIFKGDESRALNNAVRAALAALGTGASLTTITLADPAVTPRADALGGAQQLAATGTITAHLMVPR